MKLPKPVEGKTIKLLLVDLFGAVLGLGFLIIGVLLFIVVGQYVGIAIIRGNFFWSDELSWWQPIWAIIMMIVFLIGGFIIPRVVINLTNDIHELNNEI